MPDTHDEWRELNRDGLVYAFEIAVKTITGISIIGARRLAEHYREVARRLEKGD